MSPMRKLFSALGATLALSAGPATAAESLSATFDFYLGGFRIADATLEGDFGAGSFTARSDVQTRGMFDVLRMKADVSARSEGHLGPRGRLSPLDYATDYATDGVKKSVRMTFEDGVPEVSASPAPPAGPDGSGGDAPKDALDPLTAAVAAMLVTDEADICNRTIPVYDGVRRYDIVLLPEDRRPEAKDFAPIEWPVPVKRCFGVYERISGYEEELQTVQRYYPFDIWFEVTGTGVERIVRVAGKTKLGHIVGVLRRDEG